MKHKIRKIIELWIYSIHKNGNKDINCRKLVPSFCNNYLKPVVYYWKNRCKKWVPIKTWRRIFCCGVWRAVWRGEFSTGEFSAWEFFTEELFGKFDNLVKYAVWRASNKPGLSIISGNFFKIGEWVVKFCLNLCIQSHTFLTATWFEPTTT